jgi:hypothetical protein
MLFEYRQHHFIGCAPNGIKGEKSESQLAWAFSERLP